MYRSDLLLFSKQINIYPKQKGFGDLVPGISRQNLSIYSMLGGCLFSLFGMAIIASCFNIMKGAVKNHLLNLARKIKNLLKTKKKEMTSTSSFSGNDESVTDRNREKEELLNNIRLLQQYVTEMNSKRKKPKKSWTVDGRSTAILFEPTLLFYFY